MTTKLTGREALAYMATGGWFTSGYDKMGETYRMKEDGGLEFSYLRTTNDSAWGTQDALAGGSITPCPDPTVEVDQYAEKRKRLLGLFERTLVPQKDLATHIIDFVEAEFQRKEQP